MASPSLLRFTLCSLHLLALTKTLSLCPSSCVCEEKKVECVDRSLYEIPSALPVHIINLNLNKNLISHIDRGSLDKLESLIELRLNRNQLTNITKDAFRKLKFLEILELNKNKFTIIEGLSFSGLERLHTLRLQRNSISTLLDGAFYGLQTLSTLQLDYNNITNVTKSWLYRLDSLNKLTLSHNRISSIDENAWEFCKQLSELDLSYNKLNAIKSYTFEYLEKLTVLQLDNNQIEYVAEGAFNNTPLLERLELKFNKISWTIDDMTGVFLGLSHLVKFSLAANHIKTLNKKAFIGLEKIKILDLSSNNITTIQENAFSPMSQITELLLNTTSLLCDCNLKWFPAWLEESSFKSLNTSCAYPEWLKGMSVMDIPLSNFTCDDFPKPNIVEHPKMQTALRGNNVTLYCKAASSADLPMTFQWKKDNVDIKPVNVKQFVRSNDGKGTEQSSEFTLINITQSDAGKYQCVVSNEYGTTYSVKSKLQVFVFPTFDKVPGNITAKSGSTARLECAASGSPSPRISWRKDGGNDFPAARERRINVNHDNYFFIFNITILDMGVYSCRASNNAGLIMANASLTVLESPSFVKQMENKETPVGGTVVLECMAAGSPKPKLVWKKDGSNLVATERHFFTADDQLLVIVGTSMDDAGKYECEMTNSLGTEKGYCHLSVIPSSDMTGIIVITVVCCALGTSVIWVVIIYQTRKKMGLVEVVTESCQYPSTVLPSNLSSVPHLYVDTNSEHSSGKDSGTGDSAKRSSDDLLLGNDLPGSLENGNHSNLEVTNHLLPKEVQVSIDETPTPVLRSNSHSRRTDHDRYCKVSLLCGGCSQRWSAPHGVEMERNKLPPSCSYLSLPVNLRAELGQDNASHFKNLEGIQTIDEATPCVANV